MATTDEATELLKPYRAEVVDEQEGWFIAKLSSLGTSAVQFRVPVSSIDSYLKIRSAIHAEYDTTIFYPGYYEQAIETMGSGPMIFRLFRREQTGYALTSAEGHVTIELSPPSDEFLFQLGTSESFKTFRRRLPSLRMEAARRQPEGDLVDFRTLFSRILTVKVRQTEEAPLSSKHRLRDLAVAGLFNISFATGVGLTLSTSWERSYYRIGRKGEIDPQFPRRIYNKDLVAYYQLALSSDSPILAYLALYKVLEFFFTSASEKILHRRLADRIAHPEFTHKSAGQLRLLASTIRKFDQKMDEQRMLATVLEQYFMADEIVAWINEVESTSEPYFTKPQTLFGQSQTLDINPDKLHASLAARIYLIRNALVHNKEGEASRFTPFSGQEAFLYKETPFMMFLAENLIIKSGVDL